MKVLQHLIFKFEGKIEQYRLYIVWLITMEVDDSPFEEGELVESRSFQIGFRGSWFRSKIKNVSWRKGQLGYNLEFLDFPDEKKTWTKLYQKARNHSHRSSKQSNLKIMLRPWFPPVYRESQMPDISSISEVVVIVNDAWKVGDLVDWWKDDCFWSGKITQMLEDGKLQIDLLPPPLGEGFSYEVCSKDLRPSLNWSPEIGWTVPTPMDSDKGQQCARIINPVKRVAAGSTPSLKERTLGEERHKVQGQAGASRATTIPSLKVCTTDEQEREGVQSIAGMSHVTGTLSLEEHIDGEERDGVEIIAGSLHATSIPSLEECTTGAERDDVEGFSGASHASNTSSLKECTTGEERDGVEGMAGAVHATISLDSKERTDDGERDGVRHVTGASHATSISSSIKCNTSGERDGVQGIAGALQSSVPSHALKMQTTSATEAEKEIHTPVTDVNVDMEKGGSGKTSCSDDSSSLVKAVSTTENGKTVPVKGGSGKNHSADDSSLVVNAVPTSKNGETTPKEGAVDDGGSSKKRRIDGSIPLNSMFSNSIEASILDLEELVHRVKWMKSLLEVGMSSSNTRRPPWKFLGNLASSTPK